MTLLVDVVAFFIAKIRNNDLFLYHGFAIIQFTMVAMFFRVLFKTGVNKLLALYAIPVFAALAIISTVWLNPLDEYNSNARAIKHFFFTLLSLFYMNEILVDEVGHFTFFSSYICITVGLLVASLGNFFIEGLMNVLLHQSNEIALQYYLIGKVLSFIFYLSVIVSQVVEGGWGLRWFEGWRR